MAYATGTGSGQQDYLDALKSFASGLGWTVEKWDTTNRLLYISKGVCKLVVEWLNANITVYTNTSTTTSSAVVSEGRLRASLVSEITPSLNDYWTFPGYVGMPTTTGRDNSGMVYCSNLQGSFVGWHFFSDSAGNYIHSIVEVTPGVYTFFGFGIADKNGLSHSGAAYVFGDGLRYWYDESNNSREPITYNYHVFNKPSSTASAFASSGQLRSPSATFQVLSTDALLASFENSQAIPSNSSNIATHTKAQSRAMPLRMTLAGGSSQASPSFFISTSRIEEYLLDNLVVCESPEYTSFVPMFGIPLIVTNAAFTQVCAIGSVPDLRLVNIKGFSPQQEVSLGDDTWKLFPQLRLADPMGGLSEYAPSSGHYGLAFKKI